MRVPKKTSCNLHRGSIETFPSFSWSDESKHRLQKGAEDGELLQKQSDGRCLDFVSVHRFAWRDGVGFDWRIIF